ncbi:MULTISPECIES: NAD-dependent DNA ligase LigA [unclassified Candidatus Paralachnospira]|uniref:NAD-dependent DNA ligase LigA n=1 Tax=unclassified Candidatus Paralachnospira TaxID=3099471 RepID=UPI003F8DBAF4
MEKMTRMKELVEQLREASKAYYQESREIMSNYEYDARYDELLSLEQKTGTTLAGSPTVQVGYELLSELPKERHERPMLSLDKTKDVGALAEWLKDKDGLLSWKLDGLTIVLTYGDGTLQKAVTRGNGEIGEVITNNARVFANIPLQIPYKGELVLRGEAVIKYSDFYKINEEIGEADARYKNPRNLCSGTVRQLNNAVTAKRNVNFFAFSLVRAEGVDFKNSREEQFKWLKSQGFDVVEYKRVTRESLPGAVKEFAERIGGNDFPSDGLVLLYDDIAYGQSLGRTAKFPRDSIAFKWKDEIQTTHLSYIEWSASRTGLINPVAVFEPVELEGTTVSRASVHNVSIVEALELGEGDEITVYKANMIIPQIAENLTRSGSAAIPEICPVCGGPTRIHNENGVKTLYCENGECPAKKIKRFSLFVSRDAMNIDGLSEATLEKFVDQGFVKEFADLFLLDRYKEQIVSMDGFGEKSYENLQAALERAKHTTMARFVYGLGIAGIGAANAKVLCRAFSDDFDALRHAKREELEKIEGIGPVIADGILAYFASEKHNEEADRMLKLVTFETETPSAESQILAGKTFVITGSVEQFANRSEAKAFIESLGGKVTGSVTSKTDYLINNDSTSGSSKNKKAKELGIPILTEAEFLAMTRQENRHAD